MAGNTYPYTGSWFIYTNQYNLTPYTPSSTTYYGGVVNNVIAAEVIKTVGEQSFWLQHASDGPGNVIQVKRELTKSPGDVIHFQLITADDNAPIDNGYEAWLNEETSVIYADSVKLGLVRHAKKIDQPMSEQRASFNMRETMRELMSQWYTEYCVDKWITNKLSGADFADGGSTAIGESAVANYAPLFGGSATSTGTLTSADTMTLDLLYKAREAARMGAVGATAIYKLRPVPLVTGGMGYKVVLHPYSVYDLTMDADWKDTWKMDIRGAQSQLIAGERGNLPTQRAIPFARIDDMELYSYAGTKTASTWGVGSNISGATNLFLGAQAGFLALAQPLEWIEEEYFYKEYFGVMCRMVMGFDKAMFNSLDNGVIAIKVAATYHYTNV